ncbi:PspC domain-containing protein [Arthrobacter sp. ok362]|uniref:PspC domain-containing protein n=1 Tax=Arthrobacter sp. ok362 TaxID=1761745 RepID=UPI00087F8025|nr:PspC domain-containing protein [Arthrobacter sp. ok362]SDL49219.1 phage shock protein C (PspC) family protein [Arthrobacter sp. ok362]
MNPHTPHPDEGQASADRPATDRLDPEHPDSERPDPERPDTEGPDTERPGTAQPAAPAASSGPVSPPPTEPPPLYPPGDLTGPLPGRETQNFFDWIRSQGIYRGRDRWIGGVASGIAHRLGVDPLIIRGVLIVLTVFAGIGVLAYGLAWALLPEPDGRIHVQEAAAGRWTAGMTGALITSVIGFPSLGTGVWGWDRFGFGAFVWTVFWVGGAIYLVYYLTQRNKIRNGAPPMPSRYESSSPAGAATFAGSSRTGTSSTGTEQQSAASYPQGAGPAWGPPPPSGPVPPGPVPPGGYGPGSGATPPPPAAPRNLGPGTPAVAITVGSALLVGGGIKALDAANVIDLGDAGNALVWAIGAAILGLGILFAGLRGRTSGILGFFAVVALLIGAIFSVVPHGDRFRFQNADWTPSSIEQARSGFEITGGAGTVDLTKLALNPPLGSDVVVPIDATASNLTVVIPTAVPVQVQADMTMGNLHDGNQDHGGMTKQQSDYNTSKPGARLVLKISGTVSNVTIQEGN